MIYLNRCQGKETKLLLELMDRKKLWHRKAIAKRKQQLRSKGITQQWIIAKCNHYLKWNSQMRAFESLNLQVWSQASYSCQVRYLKMLVFIKNTDIPFYAYAFPESPICTNDSGKCWNNLNGTCIDIIAF